MRRRSFLRGLIASTVLAPLAARLAPPVIATATSMRDAVEQAAVVSLPPRPAAGDTTTLSQYASWIKMADLLPDTSDPLFMAQSKRLSEALMQMEEAAFPELTPMPILERVGTSGKAVDGASAVLGQYGYVSYKVAFVAKMPAALTSQPPKRPTWDAAVGVSP